MPFAGGIDFKALLILASIEQCGRPWQAAARQASIVG
jgi:hypothetical protein